MKGTKRNFSAGLITGLTVLLFLVFFVSRDGTKVTSFLSEGGWGYSISTHGKVIIYQPFIPAVEGNISFASKHDALKTARIVRRKIHDGAAPAITIKELKEAGVKMQD